MKYLLRFRPPALALILTVGGLIAAMLPVSAEPPDGMPPAPPPGPPGHHDRMASDLKLTDAQRAAIDKLKEQGRAEFARVHTETHRRLIAQLSPGHRDLLATVAGNLATGSIASYRDAAKQLDDALTEQEKQNIVRVEQTFRKQMSDAMQSQHAKFDAVLTPEQRATLAAHRPQQPPGMRPGGERRNHTPDAGMTLLRMGLGMHDWGPHSMR